MNKKIVVLLALILLAFNLIALDIPKHNNRFVIDNASILSNSTEIQLTNALRELNKSDGTQIVVLTITSLKGDSLEDYSQRVVEKWGIGQKENDNGALLLISLADKQIRIEVGYGLEGDLTDLKSGRIIDKEISPRFKQGNFDDGVKAGIVAIVDIVAVNYEYKGTFLQKNAKYNKITGSIFSFIFIFFMIIFSLIRKGGSRGRRGSSALWLLGLGLGASSRGSGGFSSGGSSFGGFSGGGGSFGGGGASGGW